MKLTYGVPLWLMKKYLADMGATETTANVMTSDGWQASIQKAEPFKIGSLVAGRITVEFSGEPGILTELVEKLHLKTMRGGG